MDIQGPSNYKFFAWLALRDRCWTLDRLARRGLPHQDACPFCGQEEETINHVLLTCVFSRAVWAVICEALGRMQWAPTAQDTLDVWLRDKQGPNNLRRKDLHTIFILTIWELWKHRNAAVFEGASPSMDVLIARIKSEGKIWSLAGKFKGDVEPFFGSLDRWAHREG